jgi:hypothetical protein
MKKAHIPNPGRVHTSEGWLPEAGHLSASSAYNMEPKVGVGEDGSGMNSDSLYNSKNAAMLT